MSITIDEKDTVSLSFVGKLDNGEVFISYDEQSPITVTIGQSELPPTVEIAIKGMSAGESKQVRVPPEEGYGLRQKDLLQEIAKSNFPENMNVKPGSTLSLKVEKDGKEHQVPATVMSINDKTVTIDYNHPLAGHHLTYEIHIIHITKP
jgi:FKBP-type peptidyl-prolyl cis-trans isomerase 2